MAGTMRTTGRTVTAAAPRTGSRGNWDCRKYKTRRISVKKFLILVSLVLFAGFAAAQNFPNRTVRLVSGVTPGAASDTMARVLAEKLSIALGQPVIVENRLGAGGVVAAKYVATAEP